MSCLSGLASKIVYSNQESPKITAGIKPPYIYLFSNPKLCLEIKKLLKLVLVSSHIMFIMFIIKNCVLKLTNSFNYCWYQATSCLSDSASKIVYSNEESPKISAGIKPH